MPKKFPIDAGEIEAYRAFCELHDNGQAARIYRIGRARIAGPPRVKLLGECDWPKPGEKQYVSARIKTTHGIVEINDWPELDDDEGLAYYAHGTLLETGQHVGLTYQVEFDSYRRPIYSTPNIRTPYEIRLYGQPTPKGER